MPSADHVWTRSARVAEARAAAAEAAEAGAGGVAGRRVARRRRFVCAGPDAPLRPPRFERRIFGRVGWRGGRRGRGQGRAAWHRKFFVADAHSSRRRTGRGTRTRISRGSSRGYGRPSHAGASLAIAAAARVLSVIDAASPSSCPAQVPVLGAADGSGGRWRRPQRRLDEARGRSIPGACTAGRRRDGATPSAAIPVTNFRSLTPPSSR